MTPLHQSLLTSLRYHPQPDPARFLRHHPGCWVVMRPDDPTVTRFQPRLSRRLDPDEMDGCQGKQWGVHFTAQLYGASLALRDLLCLRTLVADVRLGRAGEELRLATVERRKEGYLQDVIGAFPLRPHWLIETLDGFQALFRIRPQRRREGITAGLVVQDALAAALGGKSSPGQPHLVRLPGTLQFSPAGPVFFCRLLEDRSAAVLPYSLDDLRNALRGGPRSPLLPRPC